MSAKQKQKSARHALQQVLTRQVMQQSLLQWMKPKAKAVPKVDPQPTTPAVPSPGVHSSPAKGSPAITRTPPTTPVAQAMPDPEPKRMVKALTEPALPPGMSRKRRTRVLVDESDDSAESDSGILMHTHAVGSAADSPTTTATTTTTSNVGLNVSPPKRARTQPVRRDRVGATATHVSPHAGSRLIDETRMLSEDGHACIIKVCMGDLTKEATDAIVNAANSGLQHGGGVAGAIRRAGGPSIQAESNAWVRKHGRVDVGQVAQTSGGNLSCRWVVHAVGPVYREHRHERCCGELYDAVANSIARANELGACSVALPAISSGIFGFPKEGCAHILLHAAKSWALRAPTGAALCEIRFTNMDQPTVDIFACAMRESRGSLDADSEGAAFVAAAVSAASAPTTDHSEPGHRAQSSMYADMQPEEDAQEGDGMHVVEDDDGDGVEVGDTVAPPAPLNHMSSTEEDGEEEGEGGVHATMAGVVPSSTECSTESLHDDESDADDGAATEEDEHLRLQQ